MEQSSSRRKLLVWWGLIASLILCVFAAGFGISLKLWLGLVFFLVITFLYDYTKALLFCVVLFSVLQINLFHQRVFGIYSFVFGFNDALAILLFLVLIAYKTARPADALVSDPFRTPLLLMLAGSLLSLSSAVQPVPGLLFLASMCIGYIFYRAILQFVNSERHLEFIVMTVIIALFLIGILGFYRVFVEKVASDQPGILLERLGYVFTGPNGLGAILVTTMPLCVVPLMSRRALHRAFALLLVVISLVVLFSTYSRNSYAALIFSSLLISILLLGKKGYLAFAAFILLALGLISVTPNALQRTFSIGYFQYDMSALARIILWRIAANDFISHPFTGVGLMNFWFSAANVPLSGFCHNLYLSAFAETGLLGGIGVILLLITIFSTLARQLAKQNVSRFRRILFVCLLGSWAAFTSHNFLDQVWFFIDRTYEMKFFWLNLGLTAAAISLPDDPRR